MRLAGAADAAGEIIFIINYKYYGAVNECAGALARYPPYPCENFFMLWRPASGSVYTYAEFSEEGGKHWDGNDGCGEENQENCEEDSGGYDGAGDVSGAI